MKKILIAIFIMLNTASVFSQADDSFGKIALSIVMPDNIEGLSSSNLSKLETKIVQILSANGLAALGYNNNFVIYPKFAIYETNVVESGIQDITISNCELSLFIKQVDNNLIFSSISKKLKGNGKDKQLSITNALSKINIKDTDFQIFIDNGKNKILSYYQQRCNDIIFKAESLAKVDDFEQAFGLLMQVPEEVTCYSKVQLKSTEIYNTYKEKQCLKHIALATLEFDKDNMNEGIDILGKIDPTTKCYESARLIVKKNQEKLCKQFLLKSKTSIASKDFYNASNYLMQINPETSCFSEAQALIREIENKITDAEKRDWEFKKKQYNDNVQLEKQKLETIKEVAIAYYKSKPTKINYTYIIR